MMQEVATSRLVYGWGINDADYPASRRVDGKKIWCPYQSTWRAMICRCYNLKSQARQPSYVGCSVDDRWKRFKDFRSWMEKQDWQGKALDKDLLVLGNKVYGPDNCLFVNQQVNKFIVTSLRHVGKYPLGVCWDKKAGKFKAACSNLGKIQKNLGLFDCPEEAHKAYLKFKAELATILATRQDDPRVAEALLKRYVK